MSNRTLNEIQKNASMWWPLELKVIAAKTANLPRLLETQADFLSVLQLSKKDPFKVFDLINTIGFPPNLFVKHLAILCDYGGEPIKRLGKSFADIFPQSVAGQFFFDFIWNGKEYRHVFEEMPVKSLSNTKLSIDGASDDLPAPITALHKDMIAILLFASSSKQAILAGLEACNVGQLLGDEEGLRLYVQQKYLYVSRVTGGAVANSLGQTAQRHVVTYLANVLGKEFSVMSNQKIMLDGYDKKNGMPFDIIIHKHSEPSVSKVGIELSFQVTTNSTIERKSGQAAARQKLMHENGHYIAYIMDGAGNFERRTAFSTIIDNSDCTISYSEHEFNHLAEWVKMIL